MATAPVSLKQLAEGKSEGIQKATYFKVSPDIIKFEANWNGRDEGPDLDAYLLQLYTAMKAGAFIPPIDVEVVDGDVICRDGHCRTRAAQKLVDEGIPYMLEARQIRGNEADMVYHMVGTAAGRPLSPLEQGRVFLRLTRYGQTISEIAARTGLNRSTIENGLALAGAPVEVQAMVSSGQVASHLALKTVRKHGRAATEKLQEAVATAKAAGKTKATAKHVAADTPQGQAVIENPQQRTVRFDQPFQLPPGTSGDFVEAEGTGDFRPIGVHTQPHIPGSYATGGGDDVSALRQLANDAIALQAEHAKLLALAKSLAAVNIVVSTIDRAAIVQLVQIARNLTN